MALFGDESVWLGLLQPGQVIVLYFLTPPPWIIRGILWPNEDIRVATGRNSTEKIAVLTPCQSHQSVPSYCFTPFHHDVMEPHLLCMIFPEDIICFLIGCCRFHGGKVCTFIPELWFCEINKGILYVNSSYCVCVAPAWLHWTGTWLLWASKDWRSSAQIQQKGFLLLVLSHNLSLHSSLLSPISHCTVSYIPLFLTLLLTFILIFISPLFLLLNYFLLSFFSPFTYMCTNVIKP